METIKTYCPTCDSDVTATITERPETLSVRRCPTEYISHVAVCPFCGSDIGDMAVDSRNLEAAYDAYRLANHVMSPDQIHSLRETYRMSLREFSRFLGFGEQTIAKYEKGTLPDKSHSDTLALAETSDGARFLLGRNAGSLSDDSIRKVEDFIQRKQVERDPFFDFSDYMNEALNAPPSRENGYRRRDDSRVSALVCAISARCTNLFKTKLQKAMFFCDFLACERFGQSLTGLRYAHADYGPIMDGCDYLLGGLEYQGVIKKEEKGDGEIIVPLRDCDGAFAPEEIELIDEIADFVNSFRYAKDISNYSHTLDAWKNTSSGRIIHYNMNMGEIGEAVSRRLG